MIARGGSETATGARGAAGGRRRAEQEAYDQLLGYTLTHLGAEFVHQHAVDAWAAQYAHEGSRPIGVAFALVGLYLHVEKGFTGRQVQRTHMALARRRRQWPTFPLPVERGAMTASRVMAVPAGPERDAAIDAWCASVWAAFEACHQAVAELLARHGIE